ncbi:hypothetical protein OF83DRAFT_362985 [Amylostereum chailletii]|nr:hypothetical protein OF83DRAFT_362985 [Amylostereum chailletii]
MAGILQVLTYVSIAHDGTSLTWDIGPVPQTTMYFEESVHYKANSSASDDEWGHLIPDNGGLVYTGSDREPSMLSLFHQLRCLDIMRRTYAQRNPPGSLERHCLNYIRQMVLCRRDTRLEPVIAIDGPHTVQPWGAVTCTDWRRVYEAHKDNVRG